MKLIHLTIICLVFLAISSAVGAFVMLNNTGVPKARFLICSEPIQELGILQDGETRSSKFVLENVSNSRIRIHSVVASCGCTTWTVGSRELSPGQKTDLDILFNSSGKAGRLMLLTAANYEVLDTKENRSLQVRMNVEVEPDYECIPDEIVFYPHNSLKQIVEVRPINAQHIEVLDATIFKRFFSVEVKSAEDTDQKTQLFVCFHPDKYENDRGDHAELNLTILCDNERESYIRIPITLSPK